MLEARARALAYMCHMYIYMYVWRDGRIAGVVESERLARYRERAEAG